MKDFKRPTNSDYAEATTGEVSGLAKEFEQRAYITALIAQALINKNFTLSAIPMQAVEIADKIIAALKK